MKTNILLRCVALVCAMLLLFSGCASVRVKTEPATADHPKTAVASAEDVSATEAPATEAAEWCEPLYGGYALDAPGEAYAGAEVIGEAAREPADGTATPTQVKGDAFVLTAAEWNDNQNWPFFTNLVNSGSISFPSYGIDPRNRIEVRLKDADGNSAGNEPVRLLAEDGTLLWTARTDKNGVAYLFWPSEGVPFSLQAGSVSAPVSVAATSDGQGVSEAQQTDAVELTLSPEAVVQSGLQVMFIVDTTGSMSDEIAYLQMDFSSIAVDVADARTEFSACFYRDEGDEYVTRCNSFTSDVGTVQAQINAEYAAGGGDTPEAVDRILTQTLTENTEWREDCVKLAFLIFDAPPHAGTEQALQEAVRSAAEQGIRIVPVVASNADRDTELFGRALAICTGGSYVFLTDDSGVGESHLEPIVGSYAVELLHDVIVRIINEAKPVA